MPVNIDTNDLALLTNKEVPDSVKTIVAQALVLGDQAGKTTALEERKLDLERRKFFWNTPLVVALTGLITLSATFVFDRLTKRDETANTLTISQVTSALEASEARLTQQLQEEMKRTEAELAASAEERKFQYEIVKSEFSDTQKTNVQRADVLLFLVRAGVLKQLDAEELRKMAEEQKQNPKADITPPLTSDSNPAAIRNVVASIAEAPWQVALLNREQLDGQNANDAQFCAGFLISQQWVVTTAHCAASLGSPVKPGDIAVSAGSLSLGKAAEINDVASIFVHPAYEADKLTSDIALIKLSAPSKLGKPVKTADSEVPVPPGTILRVMHWGMQSEDGVFPEDLTYADFVVAPESVCVSPPAETSLAPSQLCASVRDRSVDACQGSSGGAAVLTHRGTPLAVGITSFGEGCGLSHRFSVFTRVPPFVPWLNETMAKN